MKKPVKKPVKKIVNTKKSTSQKLGEDVTNSMSTNSYSKGGVIKKKKC